jgi:hypothetical protein
VWPLAVFVIVRKVRTGRDLDRVAGLVEERGHRYRLGVHGLGEREPEQETSGKLNRLDGRRATAVRRRA